MRSPENNPISMVLLLRGSSRWSRHEFVAAAQRAWSAASAAEIIAEQSENKTVLIYPPHIVTLLNCDRPYLDEAQAFPHTSQQEAWARHTAWIAVDYHGAASAPEKAYGILASLAAELLDANCTGIFIPGERSLIPNDGSLRANLRALQQTLDSR